MAKQAPSVSIGPFFPSSPSVAFAAALGVALVLWGSLACSERNTEIVVVIDTDLAVPAELDRVELSIVGPSGVVTPPPLDLAAPNEPPFPRTLTLVDETSSSAVTIRAVGIHSTTEVVREEVRTGFVDGQKRMVRIVLTAACLGVVCAAGTETCSQGKCTALERQPDSLPSWMGAAPARPLLLPKTVGERSLWAAGWRSCATQDDNLYCWGQNDFGQLGNPTRSSPTTRVPVVGLSNFPSSIGLGYKHTCVCDKEGKAWCWGSNSDGQLGVPSLGAADARFAPVAVPNLIDCVQITAGGFHSCAIRTNRTVSCWGRNYEGQLGQPAAGANGTPIPQTVVGADSVIEVQSGERFTCARRPTGVLCWGDNSHGQIGDGSTTTRNSAVRVSGLSGTSAQLATGRNFACVRSSSSQVFCWGENGSGMIGTGASNITTPTLIAQLDDAIQIAAGHQHACALRATNTVSCWGSNQFNQLGIGAGASSSVPVPVLDVPDVTEIALGVVHSCARVTSGAVICWGQNFISQLGDSTTAERIQPVDVIGF